MTKRIRLALMISALFFSCKHGDNTEFRVKLNYKNIDKLKTNGKSVDWVYLEEIQYGKNQLPKLIDSAKLNGSTGSATIHGKSKSDGIFEMVFGDNVEAIPFINDGTDIVFDADFSKTKDFYEVSGSTASKQMKVLLATVAEKSGAVQIAFNELDSLKKMNAPDSVLVAANESKNDAITGLNNYLKQFINTTPNPTLGVLALGWASRSLPPTEMDSVFKGLKARFPKDAFLIEMERTAKEQQQQGDQSAVESWVGKTVPDMTMPGVNGKDVSISSFRGKYVLIDFWASWCGPCRMENPNVVKAYNEFKGKNFTVLGVSLDKDRSSWQKAIADDHLTWTHMSDLKYWSSEAVNVFGFQGIPFNVLVDPNGKIIGQELRGDDLETKLKQVLN